MSLGTRFHRELLSALGTDPSLFAKQHHAQSLSNTKGLVCCSGLVSTQNVNKVKVRHIDKCHRFERTTTQTELSLFGDLLGRLQGLLSKHNTIT